MAAANSNSIALIMAGGSGTRFWPASSAERPKQYLAFFDGQSLLQQTAKRIEPLIARDRIFVCSLRSQRSLLNEQLPFLKDGQLILEPTGKNTAPCLMLSVLHLLKLGFSKDSVMVVLPADHFIGDESGFRSLIAAATEFAVKSQGLVTLGIEPTFPHTGYGYIEAGEPQNSGGPAVHRVERFVEKPDLKTAQGYVSSRKYFWNSGMFLWTLGAIEEAFGQHMNDAWKRLKAARPEAIDSVYAALPSIAIDVAVMEKAPNRYVFPANIRWSDLGSWDAVYQLRSPSPQSNVVLSGRVEAVSSEGCLVRTSAHKEVALVGVKNLIVVEEGDRLLVADRSSDQKVREVSQSFKK